jgi:hypothetical protein
MFSRRVLHTVVLLWFFGWGWLLLRFPARCYQVLSSGKTPNAKQLKRLVLVGYMALFFGSLFVLELVFGLVH